MMWKAEKKMREIKFRAWDTVNKMWLKITGFETHNSDDDKTASINTGIAGMFHDGDYIGTFQQHGGEQNNVILVQYTGLKDENEKEIYEGDICKSLLGVKGVVIFDKGAYKLESKDSMYGLTKLPKIIGNIYENPELLEGK